MKIKLVPIFIFILLCACHSTLKRVYYEPEIIKSIHLDYTYSRFIYYRFNSLIYYNDGTRRLESYNLKTDNLNWSKEVDYSFENRLIEDILVLVVRNSENLEMIRLNIKSGEILENEVIISLNETSETKKYENFKEVSNRIVISSDNIYFEFNKTVYQYSVADKIIKNQYTFPVEVQDLITIYDEDLIIKLKDNTLYKFRGTDFTSEWKTSFTEKNDLSELVVLEKSFIYSFNAKNLAFYLSDDGNVKDTITFDSYKIKEINTDYYLQSIDEGWHLISKNDSSSEKIDLIEFSDFVSVFESYLVFRTINSLDFYDIKNGSYAFTIQSSVYSGYHMVSDTIIYPLNNSIMFGKIKPMD